MGLEEGELVESAELTLGTNQSWPQSLDSLESPHLNSLMPGATYRLLGVWPIHSDILVKAAVGPAQNF